MLGRRGKPAHEHELDLHFRVILMGFFFVPVSTAEIGHILRALLVSWQKLDGVLPHAGHSEQFCSRAQQGHLLLCVLCHGPGLEGKQAGTVLS